MSRLYLTDTKDVYLEKDDTKRISFCIDSEWVTEPIYREDIPWISVVFGIKKSSLEDFFDN